MYPDLIEIAATLAIHRQQIAQHPIRRRIAWPQLLLQKINERTGHAHTDITPIEQWVHNQRLTAAIQSPTADGIKDRGQCRQNIRFRTMKDVHPTAI
ncbi:Uncharacterised protein [Mycobacteroides abscessus subsp. abscessus]|nr:Uncharacterised protein [Mycobacteroides abscessus subsp. abscessus]